jgi:hypothetical protein
MKTITMVSLSLLWSSSNVPSLPHCSAYKIFQKVKRCEVWPRLLRKLSISTIPNVYHMKVYIMINRWCCFPLYILGQPLHGLTFEKTYMPYILAREYYFGFFSTILVLYEWSFLEQFSCILRGALVIPLLKIISGVDRFVCQYLDGDFNSLCI